MKIDMLLILENVTLRNSEKNSRHAAQLFFERHLENYVFVPKNYLCVHG